MLVAMQVAGHGAVVHLVSHAIVGLVVAHAALIVLQTVRLRDKPGDGGELHGTSHTPDLHRDNKSYKSNTAGKPMLRVAYVFTSYSMEAKH